MEKARWYVLIGTVAILGTAWIYQTRVPVEIITAAPEVNSSAPNFSLSTLDGQAITLGELRGKVVLVNFWATWCIPCREELRDFEEVYTKRHTQGFVILAINEGEDYNTVAQFAQEFRLSYPISIDRDGRVAKRYRVRGLPTSFFIDREGVIHAVNHGQINRAYIEAELDTLPGMKR
ncbi:MAG: TlpA family protein disulfide reductase [Chloroflexi bacterium]|nr:TlpA family protein disulfide reductase [Chloroflexota bacterium]